MSSTYTAWNGEERPWPPPENWYRAADGRWWHPAYGPGDEPDLASETGTEPEATPEPDAMAEPEPRLESELESESDPEPLLESEPEPESVSESESEPPHIEPAFVDAPNRPPGRRPLVTAALIAAVVLLAAAAVSSIVVGGSTDDLATAPDNEPAAPDADDDPGRPAPASGSDAEGDSAVGDFRRTMDEHGLSTEALTDRQITGFASSYCTHAAEAEDRTDFDELRRRAIAATGSELTPIQLDLTITTAVAVFCPAESDRLGLSEDASGP